MDRITISAVDSLLYYMVDAWHESCTELNFYLLRWLSPQVGRAVCYSSKIPSWKAYQSWLPQVVCLTTRGQKCVSVVCTHGFGLLDSFFGMRGADVRKIKDCNCKIQYYESKWLELRVSTRVQWFDLRHNLVNVKQNCLSFSRVISKIGSGSLKSCPISSQKLVGQVKCW